MKNRDQHTNQIAKVLEFPVDRRGVREPLCKDSPQPVSIHLRFHRPTQIASKLCYLPPASPVAHVHSSKPGIYTHHSMPIRRAAVERFSPIRF
jgi:hypothetical protein